MRADIIDLFLEREACTENNTIWPNPTDKLLNLEAGLLRAPRDSLRFERGGWQLITQPDVVRREEW